MGRHSIPIPDDVPRPRDVRATLRRIRALASEKWRESFDELDGADVALSEDAMADCVRAEDILDSLFAT